ncbi:MAG TPA: hypothetical protein DCY13_11310 [Verrucomicrobiales bacterium]|nr:hypothetical protein [Verrucomicrobiales bacterium]
MDWIKKNTAFVASCAVALVAIAASAYYLFVQMGKYEEVGTRLDGVVGRVNGFVQKRPHPGHGDVDNIAVVRQDIARLDDFKSELTKTFKSTPLGEETEQAFKSELAAIMAYIEKEGGRTGLTVPTNFNLSFTAQKVGFRFASNSLGPLTMQLADLREITRILVDARVNSIEAYRRVAVSSDDSGEWAVPNEYITNLKIATNDFTGAIIHPYEVVFRCFSGELGNVLEGISHSPYSLILKTIGVEPAEVRGLKPAIRSSRSLYEGMPGFGGVPSMYGTDPSGGPGARYGGRDDGGMSARYGGGAGGARGDTGMTSRYGGGAGASRTRTPVPAVTTTVPLMPTREAPRPTGPETLLKDEPLRVTLGFAVVRMPETSAPQSSTN